MRHASFLAWLCACLLGCSASGQPHYEFRKGDPDGIGKWYMGRQIAHVMSHFGIPWLERANREEEEDCAQLLANLGLRKGMQVADIGAGSGYHATRIAGRIGEGTVHAVDIEPEMVAYLERRAEKEGIPNLRAVLGSEKKIPLSPNSIDIALMVDVYHECSHPYEMGLSMHEMLKRGGRLYLVEYREEDPAVPIKAVHKMSQAQAVRELTAAGFRFERNIGNLPWQHCLVFTKD